MDELKTLLDAFQSLIDIPDEELTDEVMEVVLENLEQSFSVALTAQSMNQIIQNLEQQNLTKTEAIDSIEAVKSTIKEALYGERQLVGNKKKLVDTITNKLFNVFDDAAEKYHSYAIELPMTLAEGAIEPTYAHETDAAADLYALEDTNMNAHTYGNKIRTGVNIQLPEGWLAMILPRSSIGANTPYRLSNSVGLIDSGYRGELGVLYDNTSDDNLYIQKGARIAQLLVMPSYRFKGKIVDSLEDSDRGTGGFGSTGV